MFSSDDAVFMIGWEYPPHNSGGLGVACQGITESLSEMGTQIFFTLPHGNVVPLRHMQVLNCSDASWFTNSNPSNQPPFFAYSSSSPVPHRFYAGKFDQTRLHLLPESELEEKVGQYADLVATEGKKHEREYRIIHAHDWMSFPAARKLAQATGKPYVAHVHSTEMDRIPDGNGSQYIINTELEGMSHATRVIAVSYYTKQLLTHTYGIDPAKIDVVHNGITPLVYPPDTGRHHFAPKRPVIVFMGRLTVQKGAEYFLHLARAVLQKIPSALFIVAGSGDMYHQLLLETADQKLSAHVLFSGFVRDKQRETLLDRADVFVMPSISEPFGLVALEAAQRHTPVIVSKNAGVSEVLPSAIQTDFWDIQKMTNEIVRMVAKPTAYQQVVTGQLNDISQATWSAASAKIKEVYQKVLLNY